MSIAAKETLPPLPAGFLDKLADIVGPAGLITDPSDMAPYLAETRGLYEGASPAQLRRRSGDSRGRLALQPELVRQRTPAPT